MWTKKMHLQKNNCGVGAPQIFCVLSHQVTTCAVYTLVGGDHYSLMCCPPVETRVRNTWRVHYCWQNHYPTKLSQHGSKVRSNLHLLRIIRSFCDMRYSAVVLEHDPTITSPNQSKVFHSGCTIQVSQTPFSHFPSLDINLPVCS